MLSQNLIMLQRHDMLCQPAMEVISQHSIYISLRKIYSINISSIFEYLKMHYILSDFEISYYLCYLVFQIVPFDKILHAGLRQTLL